MLRPALMLAVLGLYACDEAGQTDGGSGGTGEGGAGGNTSTATLSPTSSDATGAGGSDPQSKPYPEDQPAPAEGTGISDPLSRSLHNRCAGIDWQRIHGWLLTPHAAPEIGPADEMARCVERYAGWVTNDADAAGVSRASVYAALAATGQCDADTDYDGTALLPPELCVLAHPELDGEACVDQMATYRSFGIETLADVLALTQEQHKQDPPMMGVLLGQGSIECGGEDRWKYVAPEGYLDRYVAAYNAYKASSSEEPQCKKRVVVSVALYTGMDDPGAEGVTGANGCWTYERIAKTNAEWKICNYDGTVHHEDGIKWVYDDTNTAHDVTTEKARINNCKEDAPSRGYIYMVNRGSGWPKRVTDGVAVHFAEIYSGQYAISDQFGLWKDAGKPGEPMINFGEPTTTATQIQNIAKDVCATVEDGGYLGVYVYPESLRGDRMSAMVKGLNACTKL
ncbi:MAG: hypothetical protein HOW73_29490 [Polyangiaceae bacterium]|nr:hypothetical protein [Polyangiaceae bacterium]